jgi:hypothetical protein
MTKVDKDNIVLRQTVEIDKSVFLLDGFARGRKQDRARVARGQESDVRYMPKENQEVSKAVKKVGSSRKKVAKRLASSNANQPRPPRMVALGCVA